MTPTLILDKKERKDMSVIAEEEGEEGDSKEMPLEFPDTEIKIRHTGKE